MTFLFDFGDLDLAERVGLKSDDESVGYFRPSFGGVLARLLTGTASGDFSDLVLREGGLVDFFSRIESRIDVSLTVLNCTL